MSSEQELPQAPRRRRKRKQTQLLNLSKEARIAVWIIMGLLGLVVVIEWHASHGYNKSLARFQQRLVESETGAALTLFEVRTTLSGFPSQTTVKESGRQVVILQWFSLFRHYQIALTLGVDDQAVIALRTGAEAPVDLQQRSNTEYSADASQDSLRENQSSRSTLRTKRRSTEAKSRAVASGSSSFSVSSTYEQKPKGEIVATVRELFQANPRTPIPKSTDESSALLEKTRLAEWLEHGILASYAKFGRKNVRRDKSVREFLQSWWKARHQEFPPEVLPQLIESGAKLIDGGCDDPLFLYAYGESLAEQRTEKSERRATDIIRKAIALFEDSGYPTSVSIDVNVLFASLAADYMDWRPLIVETFLMSATDGLIDAMAESAFRPGERRILAQQFTRLLDRELQFKRAELMARIAARSDIDAWTGMLLKARQHLHIGWKKRPTERNDSQEDLEGTAFHAHWSKARVLLLEAWNLHSELPEPAIELIEVTSVLGGVADETPRFWFDQAIRRQFDETTAYDALTHALNPRWGGSHAQIIEFGRECLATGRFDTRVPLQFHNAVQEVAVALNDPNSVYKQEGVFENYQQLLNGYVANTDIKSEKQFRESQLACVAYLSGQNGRSAKLLRKLGDNVDARAFETFGVGLADVRDALNSASNGRTPFSGHRGAITGMGFLNGESILVTSGADGTIRLWDAETQEQQFVNQSSDAVTAMALSPDGRRFVTSDATGIVNFWKYPENEINFIVKHRSKVLAMAFSPDAKYLITAGETIDGIGEIKIWDAVYGDKLATVNVQQQAIQTLAFAPDGASFVSGAGTKLRTEFSHGEVILWNATRHSVTRMIDPFSGGILRAEFAPDGKIIAVAGMHRSTKNSISTNEVQLIEAKNGQTAFSLQGHWYEITSLAFSKDGRRLFTGSRDRTVRVWDTALGTETAVLTGHGSTVTQMAISHKRSQLLTADQNGQIKKWKIGPSQITSYVQAPLLEFLFQGAVDRMQFIRNGKSLVTCDRFAGITIWDAATGFSSGRSLRAASTMQTTASAVSPDGSTVATAVIGLGENNGEILVWNVEGGSISSRLTGPVGTIKCMEFSPDGKTLATAGENLEIWLWDVQPETLTEWARLKGHTDQVTALAFAADGTTLASGTADRTVLLWKFPSSTSRDATKIFSRVLSDEFSSEITSLRFFENGASLLCSTKETTQLWTTKTLKSTLSVPGSIAVYSADFSRFACGGGLKSKTEVRIYTSESGREIARLTGGHQDTISAMTFTPDGKHILTAGRDYSVKCWNVDLGEQVFGLSTLSIVPSAD